MEDNNRLIRQFIRRRNNSRLIKCTHCESVKHLNRHGTIGSSVNRGIQKIPKIAVGLKSNIRYKSTVERQRQRDLNRVRDVSLDRL